uniref:Uncharacterized protein n=1 Tax=Romanomermis culicivorax TaxID=13658 RepID=A0A915JYT4_ROMCU
MKERAECKLLEERLREQEHSSQAALLDRARNKEMAQQGAPMSVMASSVVPPPTQFQMAQFPMMQQGPYYHQFLVPRGVQMPPPTMIPPMRSVQGEERMDIPRPSTRMEMNAKIEDGGAGDATHITSRGGQPTTNHGHPGGSPPSKLFFFIVKIRPKCRKLHQRRVASLRNNGESLADGEDGLGPLGTS